MLLRSFDFATKYFDYNSKTEFEKKSHTPINGWYKFINGQLSALLVEDNLLYFVYGEEKLLITKSHKVLLKKEDNIKKELSFISGDVVLFKFIYSAPDTTFNVSPFEYIDEDDFKWGDFVAKIINDEERKRNFIGNLMESSNPH